MKHEGSSFLCGCAPFLDLIFFAKMNDQLAGLLSASDGPISIGTKDLFVRSERGWQRLV